VSQGQILRYSPAAGILVLLVSCGGQTTSSGPAPSLAGKTPTSASTTPFTGLSTEGTGRESPLRQSSGPISLSVPTLPIGDGGSNPTNEDVCVDIKWLGKLRSMVTLTVTGIVIDGPFMAVDPATAGCTGDDGAPCVGLRLTAANNDGITCAAGIEWTGGRPTKNPTIGLAGVLTCQNSDSAACQQVRNDLEAMTRASRPVSFDYNLPPATASPSQSAMSSPPTVDTSSPSTADSTPSPPPETSTPSPAGTSAP
jgi:hypothetical protein